MGDKDVTIKGSWTFTEAAKHKVSYDWGNEAPGTETKPVDGSYYKGDTYKVDDKYKKGATVAGEKDGKKGTWTFSGWTDPNNGTMGDKDVTIKGTWTFNADSINPPYPTTGDKPSSGDKPAPGNKPSAGSNPEIRELNVITEGQNDDKTIAKDNSVIYVIGESTKATFRIIGDELKVEDLKGVLVDGQLINKTNYDVRQGSIIVTFKKSYVDSLKPGKHDVIFDTTKGTAKAELVVKDKAQLNVTTNSNSENTPAKTGDTSALTMYAIIALAAIGGTYAILRRRLQ